MKAIKHSWVSIGIIVLLLVLSVTAENTTIEWKRDMQDGRPKVAEAVSATVVLFVGAAGIGAGIGALEYTLEFILDGGEFSGTSLAAHMTVGAAAGMAHLAGALFTSGMLNAAIGVATQEGVTSYFADLLEGVYSNLASEVTSAWYVLSGAFRTEIDDLSSTVEIAIASAVQSLVNAAGKEPSFSHSLPVWIDFDETIRLSNMSVVYYGMNYSASYGTWRMTSPGTSQVEALFNLDVVPSEAFMSLIHLTSASAVAPGGGYSPIDVYVNGTRILDNYDVAQSHGDHGWHTDNWSIASYLKTGTNTIRIELENDPWAATHYWLRYISIREGVADDTTPPRPSPMTWATEPYATGQTSIRMVATIASDPSGVEYYFDETSGNLGGSDSGWQDSRVYEDTGLQPGTTYTYKVQARDKSPNKNLTGYSSSRTPKTDDYSPPSPPTGVSASDGTYTDRVHISWNAVSGAYGYDVYRGTTNNSATASWIFYSTPTGNDDTSVVPGQVYYYWVKAKKRVGDTIFVSDFSASDLGYVDDRIPPTPNPMTWATEPYATGQTSIKMVAVKASDPSGVEYSFDETSGNPGGTDSGWQDSWVYEDTGLQPGTTYTYKVKARDKSPQKNATSWSPLESATTSVWAQVTDSAPWAPRERHTSVVHNGRIWIIGGTRYKLFGVEGVRESLGFNDVWSSSDGVAWEQVTASAPWAPRFGHSSVVYNGKIWIIGGDNEILDGKTHYYSEWHDVWCSPDGVKWTKVTGSAPYWLYASSVVYDGKIWVIGGAYNMRNEVWCSSDGENWTQVTDSLPFSRDCHTSVVHNGKMWVIGGRDENHNKRNDVWCSSNGVNWTQVTSSANWSARTSHASVVFDGKIWLLGGNDLNDAWYSVDGSNWTQAMNPPGWSARGSHTSVVHLSRMWVIGGGVGSSYPRSVKSDVWCSPVAVVTSGFELDADEVSDIPHEYALAQNYPNPFNPSTSIAYAISQAEFVTLKVYDILGQEVQTLVNVFQPAGRYAVQFDARSLSSGIYFYRLQAGDFMEAKKMLHIQ